MATVYSQQANPSTGAYLRSVCNYTVTETSTQIIISGTIALQHNGAAYSGALFSESGAVGYDTDYLTVFIGQTDSITGAVKHTSWTTVKSETFSGTISKGTEARTLNLKVGLSGVVSVITYVTTVAINIPALQSYSVTFDSNGGSGGPTSQTKYEGVNLRLSSSKPSKTDYIFSHWNTALNNSGTTYNPGDTYTANAALNLHAIWNSEISYNGNGTFIDTYSNYPTQTKTYGTNLTLHSATPTRTGYVFNGWNTAADGTGTSYQPGGTYSAEVAVTLYAQWLSLPAKPQITSMTAIRWNETTDEQDDTGTSAKVTAEWSIDTTSDYYGNTNTGTVTLLVTPQSGSSSHTITPISGTSGTSGTAVFMVSGLDTDMQYTCKVTVTDLNASSNRSVLLTRAFFIMDFKAGGQGIGIGRAAPASGLEIGYNVTCDQNLEVYEDETINGDLTVEGITTHTGRISANGNIFANARMRVQKDMLAQGAELRGDMRVSGYGGISVGTSASLDDLYVAVTDETKPTFVSGEFYSRGYNSTMGTIAYTQLTSQPSDWNTAWTNYYRRKSTNGLLKITYDTEFDGDVKGMGILDMFYPVGSYYETSDTSFNPNTAWGGTWELETAGQVHVSSGTGYTVSGATTNTTDGGSPYIQEHTHAFTQPKIPNHHHSMGNIWSNGTGSSQAYQYSNSRALMTRSTATDGGGGSCTGGAVGAVSGATTGNAGNMPPYIVVNRWHRTA